MTQDHTPLFSDRIDRKVDRLLDEADAAVRKRDWAMVRARAEAVLTIEPDHEVALAYMAAAERAGFARAAAPEIEPDQA